MTAIPTDSAGPGLDLFPAPAGSRPPLAWGGTIARDYRELRRFWPVVTNMVNQELRIKYHRSVLGFFWTLLNPILMMATMAIVFSQIFRLEIKGYAIYLFAGLVPYTYLSTTLTECSLCIVMNEGLIRRIYLPKLVFPIVRALHNLAILAFSMAALFVLMRPLGTEFSWAMLALPLVMLLWAGFGLGLGLLLAPLNTFYRDCSHLMTVLLQIWYFFTPILYEADMFGERKWIFHLNPAYPFIRMFQMILRDGLWPDPATLGIAGGLTVACLGIGYAAFKSQEDKLVFRL